MFTVKKLVPAAIRNNAGIPSHLGNITAPRTRSLELESELERDCPRMLKVSNNAAPATMQMIPYETFDDMGLKALKSSAWCRMFSTAVAPPYTTVRLEVAGLGLAGRIGTSRPTLDVTQTISDLSQCHASDLSI